MSITEAMLSGVTRQILTLPGRSIRPLSASGLGVFEGVQARVMSKMDANSDGGLSAAEIAGGVPGGKALGTLDPAFMAALDKNSDGRLQLGELQASSMFDMNTLDALIGIQEGQEAEANTSPAPSYGRRFEASNIGAWMVNEADQDGDGALTAEEFASIGPAGEFAPRTDVEFPGSDILSKSGRAFFEADANKDGKLGGEELAYLMETGPHRITMGDATRTAPTLMAMGDTDGDAALSLDEARSVAPNVDGLDAAFVQGDTDRDGKLSAAEMKAMVDGKPTLYAHGFARIQDGPSAGDLALRRLLLASLDRMSEAFRSQLQPPASEITA
jgi:Ca2+-binding EF-hand superfamily protein